VIRSITPSLHRDQIDHALEIVLTPQRDLHGHNLATIALDESVEGPLKRGVFTVHAIHNENDGSIVVCSVAPRGVRHNLWTGDRIDYDRHAVCDPDGSHRVWTKDAVSRRIDKGDVGIFPVAMSERGLDRDSAFNLFCVVVRDRRSLVDQAHAIHSTRDVQAGGDQRSLAGVAVSDNGDVAQVRSGDRSHSFPFFRQGQAATRFSRVLSCLAGGPSSARAASVSTGGTRRGDRVYHDARNLACPPNHSLAAITPMSVGRLLATARFTTR